MKRYVEDTPIPDNSNHIEQSKLRIERVSQSTYSGYSSDNTASGQFISRPTSPNKEHTGVTFLTRAASNIFGIFTPFLTNLMMEGRKPRIVEEDDSQNANNCQACQHIRSSDNTNTNASSDGTLSRDAFQSHNISNVALPESVRGRCLGFGFNDIQNQREVNGIYGDKSGERESTDSQSANRFGHHISLSTTHYEVNVSPPENNERYFITANKRIKRTDTRKVSPGVTEQVISDTRDQLPSTSDAPYGKRRLVNSTTQTSEDDLVLFSALRVLTDTVWKIDANKVVPSTITANHVVTGPTVTQQERAIPHNTNVNASTKVQHPNWLATIKNHPFFGDADEEICSIYDHRSTSTDGNHEQMDAMHQPTSTRAHSEVDQRCAYTNQPMRNVYTKSSAPYGIVQRESCQTAAALPTSSRLNDHCSKRFIVDGSKRTQIDRNHYERIGMYGFHADTPDTPIDRNTGMNRLLQDGVVPSVSPHAAVTSSAMNTDIIVDYRRDGKTLVTTPVRLQLQSHGRSLRVQQNNYTRNSIARDIINQSNNNREDFQSTIESEVGLRSSGVKRENSEWMGSGQYSRD